MLFLVATVPHPHQIIKYFAHGCPRALWERHLERHLLCSIYNKYCPFLKKYIFGGDKNKFLYYFLNTNDFLLFKNILKKKKIQNEESALF